MFDGELLKAAFTSLVANRAVEGVIYQEKFHHPVTAFFHEFACGADSHVFSNGVSACYNGPGHP